MAEKVQELQFDWQKKGFYVCLPMYENKIQGMEDIPFQD